jgi:spoIIIJ-associated protein
MKTLELKATSVEEATQLAAEQLGVPADQLEVTVLDELKGLFGRPNQVTIRAVAPSAEEPPAPAPEKPAPRTRARRSAPEPEPAAPEEEAPAASEAEEEADGARPRRSRRSPRSRRAAQEEGAAPAEAPDHKADSAKVADEEPVDATEEDADAIAGILNGLIQASGLSAEASWSEVQGRYVHLEINGKEAGYLIGKRGEVLNALQSILNDIASRKLNNGVRVVLDADGFRDRRRSTLEQQARDIAKEVLARGEEAVLDSLPAFERRVIHQVLSEIEGIRTYSEGEEPNRSVVIAPAE